MINEKILEHIQNILNGLEKLSPFYLPIEERKHLSIETINFHGKRMIAFDVYISRIKSLNDIEVTLKRILESDDIKRYKVKCLETCLLYDDSASFKLSIPISG